MSDEGTKVGESLGRTGSDDVGTSVAGQKRRGDLLRDRHRSNRGTRYPRFFTSRSLGDDVHRAPPTEQGHRRGAPKKTRTKLPQDRELATGTEIVKRACNRYHDFKMYFI